MNGKSLHILSTSSTLLAFVFFVLVSVKSLGLPEGSFIDKAVALIILIFAASSFLSFISIRSTEARTSAKYETVADYAFLAGLALMTIVAMLLATDILFFVR